MILKPSNPFFMPKKAEVIINCDPGTENIGSLISEYVKCAICNTMHPDYVMTSNREPLVGGANRLTITLEKKE